MNGPQLPRLRVAPEPEPRTATLAYLRQVRKLVALALLLLSVQSGLLVLLVILLVRLLTG